MKVRKGVLIQKMGRTYIAYDNKTSVMHELNEVAYIILFQLEEGKTRGQILKKITAEFKVTKEEARADLDTFVQVLKRADLIVGKK